ncbi:MAG TPA: alpha-L-fucosidase [Burkholderiaceae bacterium]|jgi:alpha-L-fucosidase
MNAVHFAGLGERLGSRLRAPLGLLILLFLLAANPAAADTKPAGSREDQGAWFQDARFGLFIHWGLYSQIGGEWQGKRYYGITEWLMRRAKIPAADYALSAKDFNPTDFDAKAWVRTAKAAGIKYIVITAKHHDGFAMYGSKASAFNIVDATPFKRDPLRELADAARAEGLKIGFYYSQFQDWSDPNAEGNDWDFPAQGRQFSEYLHRKAIPQITELLTRYGPISVIWFDTPQEISKADSQKLYDLVKQLQPDCLVSSRIGNGLGDFTTYGDAEIPAKPSSGLPWEAIFTHNDSWGYSSFDTHFKSSTELVHLLATVASKGGNMMLNVGPDGAGRMPQGSVTRLARVGEWLKRNGRSIYGTSAVSYWPLPWGVMTQRPGELYLHVLERPRDGQLIVPGVKGRIDSMRYLNSTTALKWRQQGDDIVVSLPASLPDPMDSVIVVKQSSVAVDAVPHEIMISRQYGLTALSPATASLSGSAKASVVQYYHYFGDWKYFDTVTGLNNPESTVSWRLRVLEPGDYRIDIEYTADDESAGQEGLVTVADQQLRFQTLETGKTVESRPAPLFVHAIGVVTIKTPGVYPLTIRPAQTGHSLFTIKQALVTPSD